MSEGTDVSKRNIIYFGIFFVIYITGPLGFHFCTFPQSARRVDVGLSSSLHCSPAAWLVRTHYSVYYNGVDI